MRIQGMTDKKPQTPLELFEYKNKNCKVPVQVEETSDLIAKAWCKKTLNGINGLSFGILAFMSIQFSLKMKRRLQSLRKLKI